MMDGLLEYCRMGLYALLALMVYNLYQAWQVSPPHQRNLAINSPMTANLTATSAASINNNNLHNLPVLSIGDMVHVETDFLSVDINLAGGNLVGSKLLRYPLSLHSNEPLVLFNHDNHNFYVAEFGINAENDANNSGVIQYSSAATTYALQDQQNELKVVLSGHSNSGLNVVKEFIFTRGSYVVTTKLIITNDNSTNWQGRAYYQLLRADHINTGNDFANFTYFGAAISSNDKPFEKITFKAMRQANLAYPSVGGWAAMVQHYFVGAWIPEPHDTVSYYSKVLPNNLYTIGVMKDNLVLPPNTSKTSVAKLYIGPTIADNLAAAAPGLQLTIDYGTLWPISSAIFWLLQAVQKVLGNWGWSIVVTTILIKLLFYKLSAASYRSMHSLKQIQPKLERLKALYAQDRTKLTQATIELYRQEKINPMGGCVPMLIQIPVFIALYWVLVESVQLRHADFIAWIYDLTAKDPYYVLPVLVGLSMFLQQRLSPPPPDPMQAKLMMFMPVVFTALFSNCPAGLMLYWLVNNLLSVAQQWYVMRTMA